MFISLHLSSFPWSRASSLSLHFDSLVLFHLPLPVSYSIVHIVFFNHLNYLNSCNGCQTVCVLNYYCALTSYNLFLLVTFLVRETDPNYHILSLNPIDVICSGTKSTRNEAADDRDQLDLDSIIGRLLEVGYSLLSSFPCFGETNFEFCSLTIASY